MSLFNACIVIIVLLSATALALVRETRMGLLSALLSWAALLLAVFASPQWWKSPGSAPMALRTHVLFSTEPPRELLKRSDTP